MWNIIYFNGSSKSEPWGTDSFIHLFSSYLLSMVLGTFLAIADTVMKKVDKNSHLHGTYLQDTFWVSEEEPSK